MNKAGPTNITLSAIAGIYILAQVIIVPALPDLGKIFSSDSKNLLVFRLRYHSFLHNKIY